MDLTLKAGYNTVRLANHNNTVILRAMGANVTSQSSGGTYSAQYNEVSPVTFYVVPNTQALDEISVKIVEAFDGTGASLKIGTAIDDDRFFEVTDVDLTDDGTTYQKGFDDLGEISLVLTIDPGVGATQGEILIQISTTKQGV